MFSLQPHHSRQRRRDSDTAHLDNRRIRVQLRQEIAGRTCRSAMIPMGHVRKSVYFSCREIGILPGTLPNNMDRRDNARGVASEVGTAAVLRQTPGHLEETRAPLRVPLSEGDCFAQDAVDDRAAAPDGMTSTSMPSRSTRSARNPATSKSVAPCSKSTMRSMSESGVSSPRTADPNTCRRGCFFVPGSRSGNSQRKCEMAPVREPCEN
jgi:hypothetical protein